MRYTILKHKSLVDMVAHVEEVMAEGWKPKGGIAVGIEFDDSRPIQFQSHFYAQAMILVEHGPQSISAKRQAALVVEPPHRKR